MYPIRKPLASIFVSDLCTSKKIAAVHTPRMENRIKELRKTYGLSQEAVADRCKTTKATIQKLENGKMKLTTIWMDRIAKGIGCAPSDLLNESSFVAKKTALLEPETAIIDVFKGIFGLLIDKKITNETEILAILDHQQVSYLKLKQKGSLEVVRLLQESVVGKTVASDIQKIQQTLKRVRDK